MSKPPSSQKLPRWRTIRLKSTPAVEVGTVEALNAEAAIKTAIEKYGITNPQQQERLAARPVR
jgi:hypothetical protein